MVRMSIGEDRNAVRLSRSDIAIGMRCNNFMNVNITDSDLLNKARATLMRRKRELTQREMRDEAELSNAKEAVSADSEEQAVEVQNFAALESSRDAAIAELQAVNRALERIDRGIYGACAVCGRSIDPRRLSAVPHATACVTCIDHG
jgi:RNA polymerase-binding transcription factor DksA